MADLRRRDLEQHEGPAEPGWAHRDPGPTEDAPGTRPDRTCRTCGCTEANACEFGCWWVAYDLCSSCERGPR